VIVISGVLVLVALILLVVGLVDPSLGYVYASIGVSLAAFAFLVVGILQRRKEVLPVTQGAPASAEEMDVVLSKGPEQVSAAASAPASGGRVLVVEGRPRYHVEGCRYLAGKDARSVDVGQARSDGFTACGVCKPDEALAAAPSSPAEQAAVLTEAAAIADPAPEPVAEVPAAPVTRAPARKTAAKATPVKRAATTAAKAPAKKAAPAKAAAAKAAAPAKKAPAKAAAAKATAAKAAKAPAKKAAAKAPAKKAAAKKAPAKRV
jgi:hypothetical protein